MDAGLSNTVSASSSSIRRQGTKGNIYVNIGDERGRGVKVQNWPHILLKNNAWHRIKSIYYFNCYISKFSKKLEKKKKLA